jgi:DMSO reductase family type II enzyme molybdopterin subunit
MTAKSELTRRGFLRGVGATTGLVLSLGSLRFRAAAAGAATEEALVGALEGYQGWQDLYRQRWTWDRIAKGTHFVNCWYQRACNWNIFVKDGLVLREEQSGSYPQTNPEVPDFNPRGCQKGACYSHRMYDPGRVKFPLKRVGERGAGKWKRASWEEALRDIADKAIDVLSQAGPGAIIWDPGSAHVNGCNGMGLYRSGHLLDTPILSLNSEIGDHHPGATVTCGKIVFASSADDMFYSDLVLIWGGNPVFTQIPNAHFINEARYHGAEIVTIAPDYNASAVHADRWVPVIVGADAALGLSMAHVIVEEGLHDESFIIEQTDLPFLVRKDTRRFLRARDLEDGGGDDVFFVYDRAREKIQEAPKRNLSLNGIQPALNGEFEVKGREGPLRVTPAFALLRERLAEYGPEVTAKIAGTSARTIRDLARRIAKAKAATMLTQSNSGKFYHGVEIERAQILVFALCGQIGKKGSGITGFPFLHIAGVDGLMRASGYLPPGLGLLQLGAKAAPSILKAKLAGHTTEMMIYDLARQDHATGGMVAAPLFFYRHAGLEEPYGSAKRYDPWMKREFADYLAESVEKGWQLVPETAPRIFFEAGANFLRRVRNYDKMMDGLLPKLDLLVTIDWRMSNTALHSDYVLPAAGWYEKDDITWATPISPFAQVVTRATDPLAESKPDWEIHCLFMKMLQQRAKEQGIRTFRDRHGGERRLDRIYDDFTFRGRYTEDNTEDLLEELLATTTNLGDTTWKEIKEKGFERYTELGMSMPNLGNATEIKPGETITANTLHTEAKMPWPTLTRRLQFYIDHDYFLELGEELPIHKDDPAIGGDYPLSMTGGHARWSIHSTWRDEQHLLQLQRGEPLMVMSPEDATTRAIQDGDLVRVWNDVGSFEVRVRISPATRPRQVIVYHAWEPFQFKGRKSHQALIPSPINPIQVAGGYYHLQPVSLAGEPGSCDRGTRVQVENLSSSRATLESLS